jgi:hypothetical protein
MRSAACLALVLSACGPNPAFDPNADGDASGSAGPGSTSGPTEAPPPGTSTGGSEGTVAGPTDDGATAPIDESTSSTIGTSGTSGETGTTTAAETDTTTGAPASCWDQPIDSWPPAVKLSGFSDASPSDPELSPDGLDLVYIAGTAANRQPFRSSRAGPFMPFPNGAPIDLWGDADFAPGYPTFTLGVDEVVVASDDQLYAAAFKAGNPNDQYGKLTLMDGVNTMFRESHPNGILAGTRLLFQREDGPPVADLMGSFRFYEARRAAPVALGAFGEVVDVSPAMPPLQLVLCPALAPTGLDLFFISTEEADIEFDSASEVMHIYHVRRADLDAAWGPSTRLDSIPSSGGVLCPSSVTADGCAFAYYEFQVADTDPPYAMFLAERPL